MIPYTFLRISSPRCHIRHQVMLDRDTSVWAPYGVALLWPSHCLLDLSKSPPNTAPVVPKKEGRIRSTVVINRSSSFLLILHNLTMLASMVPHQVQHSVLEPQALSVIVISGRQWSSSVISDCHHCASSVVVFAMQRQWLSVAVIHHCLSLVVVVRCCPLSVCCRPLYIRPTHIPCMPLLYHSPLHVHNPQNHIISSEVFGN